TKFEYDAMGRISKQTLPNGTISEYKYPLATSSTPAQAEAITRATANGAELTHDKFDFDDFGRVTRIRSLQPDGSFSFRETLWNALGQKTSVSEVVSDGSAASKVTTYDYDAFGRQT